MFDGVDEGLFKGQANAEDLFLGKVIGFEGEFDFVLHMSRSDWVFSVCSRSACQIPKPVNPACAAAVTRSWKLNVLYS